MRKRYRILVCRGERVVGVQQYATREPIDTEEVARRALQNCLHPMYGANLPEWDNVLVDGQGVRVILPRPAGT